MIDDFGDEIRARAESCVLFNARNKMLSGPDAIHIHQRWGPSASWFSTNPHAGVYSGGATLVFALQVGFFMGIRDFVLYGVDHKFTYSRLAAAEECRSATGEGNHFIPNYRSGKAWWPPNPDQLSLSYRLCDQFLRERGGSLVNATRGGMLESVERISFEEAIKLP